MANFTIIVDEYVNQPASEVGDGSATINYGETLVYTRAMFTTNTTPPYADPEGDAALNLKVLSLPIAGLLKLSGVNITINQIIPFTSIDSGLMTYVPDGTVLTAYNTSFTFSIADAGSGQYTE